MTRRASIAVVGAGLIGRRHAAHIAREAELAAVVDPAEAAREVAESFGAPWFADLSDLIARARPDGVIVAVPNNLHVEVALRCVAAGIPVLVEKPIAADVPSAEHLVREAEAAGVAVLVGHHRRHNPLIRRARELIEEGRLGRLVAAQASCWFRKPDAYFQPAWRREPGAGPVFVNLIHDIDLLRHLCGEVAWVQAAESSAARGHAVEDSAAILLGFKSGALATMTVSDAAVAPWSWEMTAAENPDYPRTGEACCRIAGTHGALSIPDLGLWRYSGERSWWEPIERLSVPCATADPLALQARHFAEVALGLAEPLVSGREGLATLKVVAAVKEAARTGRRVEVG